jgi:hypothetical protein
VAHRVAIIIIARRFDQDHMHNLPGLGAHKLSPCGNGCVILATYLSSDRRVHRERIGYATDVGMINPRWGAASMRVRKLPPREGNASFFEYPSFGSSRSCFRKDFLLQAGYSADPRAVQLGKHLFALR